MKILNFLVVVLVMFCFHISWATENVETNSKSEPSELRDIETPPETIKVFRPKYPLKAGMYFVEGRVKLKFIVTTEGIARDIEVVESFPEGYFEESAIEAVKKYRFKPGMKDGKPVDTIVKLPISYTYDNVTSSYDYYKAYKNGRQQVEDGAYEAAIDSLTTAIKIFKKHSPAYYLRGLAYREIGDYEKALSDIKKAIKIDKEEAVYYYERGNIYNLIEDYQKAVEDFSKSIEIDPGLVQTYFSRGDAFRLSAQYETAIADYTKGSRKNKFTFLMD